MGSFNTTCFASGQTIAPREMCYVLPIVQAHSYRPVEMTFGEKLFSRHGITSSTCYPDAFWQPFGGFIKARYDDYGSVALADTPTNRLRLVHFFTRLAKHAAVVAQGENEYHDVPFDFLAFLADKAPFLLEIVTALKDGRESKVAVDDALVFPEMTQAWEYVGDAVREHRLFAGNNHGQVFPVEFAIMHGAAYDKLIAILEAEKNYDGQPMDQRSFFDRAIAKALSHIDDPEFKERLTGMLATHPELAAQVEQSTKLMWVTIAVEQAFSRLGESSGQNHPAERHETSPANHAYSKGELDLDGLFEAFKPALDARYVWGAMDMLNVRVTPMVYASQDYNNSIGSQYADFVHATRERVNAGRRKD